jgi:nucleotide-binding universal stress UspA family protein
MKTKLFFTGRETLRTAGASAPQPGQKEILVPVDFSGESVAALHRAADIAAQEHAHLTVLNVVKEPASIRTLDAAGRQAAHQHDHASRLQQLAERELGSEVSAELLVRDGEPSQEIARVAAQRHADLIVLGRHRHHGWRRWFRSRTVSRVARLVHCRVMVLDPAGTD